MRMAVLPAPTPKKVRPGAMALIVAIPAALTGGGRVPDIAHTSSEFNLAGFIGGEGEGGVTV